MNMMISYQELVRTFPNNVKINNESIMLAPLSSANVALKNTNANQYKMTIIDDHGNYISDNVSLK